MDDVVTINSQAEAAELYETSMRTWRLDAFKHYLERIMPTNQFQRMNHFQKCMDTVSGLAIAVSTFGDKLPPKRA